MKKATIRIDKNSILEQIAKKTSYIGDKMQSQQDAYDRIFVTDADSEFFEEMFELAHSECVEMLSPYIESNVLRLCKDNIDNVVTDGIDDQEQMPETVDCNIKLCLPEGLSQSTVNLVEKQVNDYIVSRLLAEWMMTSNIESHSYWIERYSAIRKQIGTTLTTRTIPVRRQLRPF